MRLALTAVFILFLCGCGAEPAVTTPAAPPIPAIKGPAPPDGCAIPQGLREQFPLPVDSFISYKTVDQLGKPYLREVYVYGGPIDLEPLMQRFELNRREGWFTCRGHLILLRNGLFLSYDLGARTFAGLDENGKRFPITSAIQE